MKKKETSKKKSAHKKDFLVVGLGASAGGVRAIQNFFSTMPPNSGMAFVVILHLSPEHESNLREIVQAQTAMPVTLVSETHKVEPNRVYVIPPNKNLEMADGIVRCTNLKAEGGTRIAIDLFFRTLADEYGKNAVCVVLSGSGTDGTLGLKAVKEANGFAIVQDPRDAEYESMPRSAIATGIVDWVLPVNQMAEKLIQFRDSSNRLHLTGEDSEDGSKIAEEIQADESLREILTVLRVRTGHDFSNYKTPTLIRRIARHLQIHNLPDIPAYLDFLRENPHEINSLLKNLLINVTNFFRDKDAWKSLEGKVVPRLFAEKRGGDSVRVWSCGCASGEEAYSLAMILSEYASHLKDPPKIQVFATDVDEDAIAEAREHRYPQSIEADVSPERLRQFFVKEGKYYRIKKELREMVLFAPHNVLRDPPFSKLDLIACRNLLIYLNRETQERVMEIFHFALAPSGFLFLGSSETAESVPQFFATVDKKYRLYSRRPTPLAQQNLPPMMPVVGRWERKLPDARGNRTKRAFSLGEVHYKLLEQIAPPSILVNQNFEIQYLSESAGRYLRFKGGEPSNNLLKLINPDLLPDLRAALFSTQHENKVATFPNVRVRFDGGETTVTIIVRAVEVEDRENDFLLVLFDENNIFVRQEAEEKNAVRTLDKGEAMEAVVLQLESELSRTKESLRSIIEQHEVSIEELKASNEELQAINEELRSTTEELETSKEELQSVNEELTTVNHELKEKIDETTRTNSDLQNLMAATDIATIFLDRNFRIKRYTPPVEKLFNITYADIGRPLEHFTHRLDYKDLQKDAAEVLRTLMVVEREVKDEKNLTYLTRFVPYRTIDDRIEGVVLNFVDITDRKRAEEAMRESEEKLSTFVNATSEAVYEMSADWSEMHFLKGKQFIVSTEKPRVDWTEEYIPADERTRVWAAINQAIKKRSNFELEYRVIRLDGTEGWAFSRAIPLFDGAGKIVKWFGAASDITNRKRAEEALRASEEKYRTLFNSMDEGFCIIQMLYDDAGKAFDWRFLQINRAFEINNGLQNAEGKTIRELTPNIEPKWIEIYDRIARTGKPLRFEEDSKALERVFSLYAFRIGEPQEHKVAVIFTDITQRKQSEEALRESEQRLAAIFAEAEVGISEISTDGRFLRVNDALCRILARTREKLLRLTFAEITHPEDIQPSLEAVGRLLETGKPEAIDVRYLHSNGEIVWANSHLSLLKVEKQSPVILAVTTDLTARKLAEEALRKSEEHLSLILESTKDYAIITFDLDGRITRWNAGAENTFGWTEMEAIGQSTHLIFTPEDNAAGEPEKELAKTLKTGRAEDERWHQRKDGTRFYASGVMQLLRDGEVEGFVKICRDQTERLNAETVLRDKEMLAQLVSTQEDERRRIARDLHDHLGQQLTSLRLKLNALKKLNESKAVAKEIQELQQATEQLDRDIDFLSWELRPASLDDLGLRASLQFFVGEFERHTGIKTEFHASGLGRTPLDFEIETNLYRIAQEALNNAYKHAKAKNISVLLEKRKNLISLIIEDDGVGFNPADKKNRSKGIGLLGMNERAKICGGTAEIESTKNKGTTIFVRIPFKKKTSRRED